MGRLAKELMPTGYDVPGMLRRFIPRKGSANSPAATWAASTVLGTVAAYQPSGSKARVERSAPPALTLREDCKAHPWRNSRRQEDSFAARGAASVGDT